MGVVVTKFHQEEKGWRCNCNVMNHETHGKDEDDNAKDHMSGGTS